MKKTSIFLTSALIVMAILAGCSDTVAITGLPQNVKSGTINQIGDFLTGQTFDPKKFTVDITYDNGQVITDDGSVTVQLDGTGNTVEKGATVTALLGDDVYGEDVYATGSVAVYDINRIEVTGPASYAKGAVIPATDLTVTAYYYDSEKTEKTMPLATSEFKIVEESTEYANGKGTTPSIPEVAATIKVQSKLDNNVVAGTFAYTETYADTTVDLPYEIESIEGVSYTGQLLALNYDEVPVPALEDVAVTVKGDDNTDHEITAADLEGATARFVDASTGIPLEETNLYGKTSLSLKVELLCEGYDPEYSDVVTPAAITLKVQPKSSFALTEGEELGTADAADFTVYYTTTATGTVATVLDADDFTINYVGSDGKTVLDPESIVVTDTPKDGEVSVVYAFVEYMGASKTSTDTIPVTAVKVVPESITAVNFVETYAAPAKQYYDATESETLDTIVGAIPEGTIDSFTVHFSNDTTVTYAADPDTAAGEVAIPEDSITLAYYLDDAEDAALADAVAVAKGDDAYDPAKTTEADGSYFEDLAGINQIYVQVTFRYAENEEPLVFYKSVNLVDPYTLLDSADNELILAASVSYDRTLNGTDGTGDTESATPMMGAEVTYTVVTSNENGVIDPAYAGYNVIDQTNGLPINASQMVGEVDEKDHSYSISINFTYPGETVPVVIYANGDSENGVITVDAGKGYARVSNLVVTLKELETPIYVGDVISNTISEVDSFFEITGGFTAVPGKGEKDADVTPVLEDIIVSTQQKFAATGNTVTVKYSYLNEDGEKVETTAVTRPFNATSYTDVSNISFTYTGREEVKSNNLYIGKTYTARTFTPVVKEYGNDTQLEVIGICAEGEWDTDPETTGEALVQSVTPTEAVGYEVVVRYTDKSTNKIAYVAVVFDAIEEKP